MKIVNTINDYLSDYVLLILLVQLFQTIGTWLSKKCDKRLK